MYINLFVDFPAAEQYQAVYTYSSTESGDLTFNQGDIILVLKAEGDWWTGSFGNKEGIFPANYVKRMENQVSTYTKILCVIY